MKLGKYKVDYFGEIMEVELVKPDGLKQPVFIIDGELTPIDLVDSFKLIEDGEDHRPPNPPGTKDEKETE